MVRRYSILQWAAAACSIGFWTGFFLLFQEASQNKPVDMRRVIAIAVGAVGLYVVSVMIKRHLKRRGVSSAD